MCRVADEPCVLDPPTFESWLQSGRAGTGDEALASWAKANESYTAGLAFLRPGTDECLHGHTDHLHASDDDVGVCRETLPNDECGERPPPFLCVCVSTRVKALAQDPLGEELRFNLMLASFFCLAAAAIFIFYRLVALGRDYVARHCARSDALQRIEDADEEEQGGALPPPGRRRRPQRPGRRRPGGSGADGGKQSAEETELKELWLCSGACTFWLAIVGGPVLMLIAWPQSYGYWVGCGFPIPHAVETGMRTGPPPDRGGTLGGGGCGNPDTCSSLNGVLSCTINGEARPEATSCNECSNLKPDTWWSYNCDCTCSG